MTAKSWLQVLFCFDRQIPINDAAESRDFNAKQSQSYPKMEAQAKLKEKRIGGCLPNIQCNLRHISFLLSQQSPSLVQYSL
jgi:hypothetical protein